MDADFNGAKVALFVGDQLLIILRDDRADIPFPNMWDFPGGGREGDESPFETMARETYEEVSLIIPAPAIIWERKYQPDRVPVWFFVARLPAAVAPQIRLGDEGQAWRLVPPETFLTLDRAIPNLVFRLRDWMTHTG